MADDPPTEGADGASPEGGEAPKKKFLSGKMLIIVAAGGLVLLLGIGAGVFFLFFAGGPPPEQVAEEGPPKPAEPAGPVKSVYFNMPDLLVNLNAGAGRRTSFLKLTMSVELRSIDDAAQFEANLPRIVDNFQVYLRELRPEDLRGSSGFLKLREELLTRVQLAAAPARVNDILFREMLVQ
ncbi:MAG: flagellar basal body-associated FliL family protein [Alphaproteobacteria bacterium]|nr:flagellar basal body-associated FliL family protein [Alphaproteobacteria bacterium]MBN9497481.1 flagellar basal body-associated FliL family protein [Alphaproteobacteria bacterium]